MNVAAGSSHKYTLHTFELYRMDRKAMMRIRVAKTTQTHIHTFGSLGIKGADNREFKS